MKNSIAFSTAFLITSILACAQVAKQEPPQKVQTKFEQFQSKDGVLKITEFFEIAAPPSDYGKTEATLIRSRTVDGRESAIGLRISYKGLEEYSREAVEFLDEDEIDSLLAAVSYMIRNQAQIIAEAKTYTEITYSSRGGFGAGFYYQPDEKKSGFYAKVGHETVFLADLVSLQKTVSDAKEKLNTLKQASK